MSLGYVTVYLVRDELDVKYYVNLWKNELKEYIMVANTIQVALIQR